ncbi:hypothetical protein DUI87_03632 [Hirundo rustica rustica]|uniref:Uncharacterized protein n=1 Tax=Hirundo rustica rustica TaxID=333673 RepID=A0A3M0L0Q5_HIRRU|nr:hypothetical protein DUI87_03632 [Hirundo rustica rustica]
MSGVDGKPPKLFGPTGLSSIPEESPDAEANSYLFGLRAAFLSKSMGEPVVHECLETIEATYSSCPDLKDTLLENTETWSTDGSSYVISERRRAGYVVTTSKEAAALTSATSVMWRDLSLGKQWRSVEILIITHSGDAEHWSYTRTGAMKCSNILNMADCIPGAHDGVHWLNAQLQAKCLWV